jgi:hypothetical protein
MTDWDYKMQIECAKSFIAPIKMNVSRDSSISSDGDNLDIVNRVEKPSENT